MAFTSGFFNSQNHDRTYNAEQMSAIFDGVITDGVYAGIGSQLTTLTGTGLQVLVQAGRAWFDHTWSLNDAPYPLTIETADDTRGRIDAVVLETDHTDPVRNNSLKVVKGTPSANPQKPTLLDTVDVKQHALAYITVPAGATSIASENIELNVGKTGCPFVTSILQQTDITALFSQWNGQFHEWFDDIQAQLSGSVATNLQNQIDSLRFMTGEIPSATCDYLGIPQGTTMRDFLKDLDNKTSKNTKTEIFVVSGKWYKPANAKSISVELWGGGGGGGKGGNGVYSGNYAYPGGSGGGGGSGYKNTKVFSASEIDDSVMITIGSGGGSGSNGSPTSFGTYLSANGGSRGGNGGAGNSTSQKGGAGGSGGTGQNFGSAGEAGVPGMSPSILMGGKGGADISGRKAGYWGNGSQSTTEKAEFAGGGSGGHNYINTTDIGVYGSPGGSGVAIITTMF